MIIGGEDPTGKEDEEFIVIIKEIESKVLELKQRLYLKSSLFSPHLCS